MSLVRKLLTTLALSLLIPGYALAYVIGGAGAGATSCPGTTWASLTGTPPAGAGPCYISNAASCTAGTQVTSSGSTPCVLWYVNGGWYPAGGAASGSGLPATGNEGNSLFDTGSAWASVAFGLDISCSNTSIGQCTVSGINGMPINGNLTSSVAGQGWCTNSSNQLVPCAFASDPNTTVGQVGALSAAGTPNTYSSVTPSTQGTLWTSNGATSLPTYQANEAPESLSFDVNGVVSSPAGAVTYYQVCPTTLRMAPGFATSYPFVASQATIGTNPGEGDTYTLTDVTNSNASVGTAAVTTGGAWTFNTTGCSASFDGTQGSTAWARSASATSLGATIPTVATGDGGFLLCMVAANTPSWTTPSGWTPVTGGSANGAASSMILYERNMVSGDSGGTVTCTSGLAAAGMNASVYTLKGVPTSGEIVDVVSVVRGSSGSVATTHILPTHNGELVMQGMGTGSSNTVSSWSPATTNVATSANGTGAQYVVQGTATDTGTVTATLSGSGAWGGFQVAFLNSGASCTLCTAGDKMKLASTTASGSDLHIKFIGVK